MRRALLPLILLAAALGCGPHRIPGTELEDTGDTRAIIETIARYNSSLEARDANGILALVDPAFRDNAGTLTPDDDIDIERLRTVLPQRLAKLQDVAVRIEIKTIDVKGDKASAVYTWVSQFKFGGKSMTESDIKRMELRRGPDGWKILSGI
ncbi:MAG: nuclear transport factor 2 family protein [Myxococcaceae bacterium]|nr:MAG: nuclear transport factor 2 family protein [Myxococcaceae bacterium]